MGKGLDILPVESILHILSFFENPHDLAAVSQCNQRLYEIASSPLLWSGSLMTYWKHGNQNLAELTGAPSTQKVTTVDMAAKAKFRSRKMQDLRIEKCIMQIVDTPHARLKYVDAISDTFMDAADSVRNFRLRNGRSRRNYGIDYYCRLIERHLSRKMGIHVLQKIGLQQSVAGDGLTPLLALFGIGCFRQSDGLDLDLPATLDSLQKDVLRSYRDSGEELPGQTNFLKDDLLRSVDSIMDVLNNAGIRAASGEDYYDLRNSFLYCAMKEHRPTIPITMVAIFVALCTRLGLKCYAIGFPGQVLAVLENHDNQIFVAPYENGRIYDRDELVGRLHSYGLIDIEPYLSPCSVQELCQRSARNILNCIERGSGEDTLDGLYASLVALKLMGARLPLAEEQFITLVCLHYPYDISIWEKLQIADHQEAIRRVRLADVTVRKPKLRSEQTVEIRHRVGTIFRHALFNYTAVITGWDSFCDQSKEWITQMGVNSLERKAVQPFYNVLANDGSERYVAEDNVLPLSHNEMPALHSLANLDLIGKYFRSSIGEKFVLSSDLAESYPEDIPA